MKKRFLRLLADSLDPGETVLLARTVQVKGALLRPFVASTAVSLAAGVAMSALGQVPMVSVGMPACWFVSTDRRVLLMERTDRRFLGRVLLDAPHGALTASLRRRLLNEVTLADRRTGESVVRLNLGAFGGRAREIVAAVNG